MKFSSMKMEIYNKMDNESALDKVNRHLNKLQVMKLIQTVSNQTRWADNFWSYARRLLWFD